MIFCKASALQMHVVAESDAVKLLRTLLVHTEQMSQVYIRSTKRSCQDTVQMSQCSTVLYLLELPNSVVFSCFPAVSAIVCAG